MATTYAVGGTITGIAGTGLILDNGGDTVTIAATDKTFAFPKKLAKGASYSIKVKTQPTGPVQTCAVTAGDGTVSSADVTSVKVNCTTETYAVSVNVVGLEGAALVLQNNAGDDLALTPSSPVGPLKGTFTTKVASGQPFAVTVKTQPTTPNQVCSVTGGTGTVVSGDVTTITVNCTDSYSVGGTIAGLSGKGLVLQNNAGDDIAVNMNGTFAFAKIAFKGDPYAVTIKTQPTDPWQTCTIAGPTGTVASADVTSVAVTCTTNQYAISGTVSGLTGTGALIQNNGGDDIKLAPGATKFAFATNVASGTTYTVTVLTQPTAPTQTCTVTANGGPTKVAGADVTNVTIACTTNVYKVTGTVSGLTGAGLVLQNNGGDDIPRNANGAYAFATTVASGMPYAVTIKTQSNAANETCALVAPTSGTIGGADAVVNVICSKTKKVFASSGLYDGNMGGLAGADAKCQGLANAAGLPGTYMAWLSDNTGTPSTRFTKSAVAYVLVDGTVVATSYATLTGGGALLAAISKTEKGTAAPSGTYNAHTGNALGNGVYSNTTAAAAQAGASSSCTNWTSNGNGGSTWGRTDQTAAAQWSTYASGGLCTWTAPIYCFQQ